MQPLISVIVPIYKVELYLRKCINSILAQTYQNLEVILVDDGSPDQCGIICDEYAKSDSRVRVIHQENSGVASARNAGLQAAQGDYIGFVDSDDWIAPDMYDCLYLAAQEHQADITVCEYYNCWNRKNSGPHSQTTRIYRGREATEALLSLKVGNYLWNKLFKRELWTADIRFPVGKLFEDVRTIYKVIQKSEIVVAIPEPKYYYRRHNSSITRTTHLKNHLECVLSRMERFDDIAEDYPSQRAFMLKNIFEYIHPLQSAICTQSKAEYEINKTEVNNVVDFLRRHAQEIIEIHGFGRLGKLSYHYLCQGNRKGWVWAAQIGRLSNRKEKAIVSTFIRKIKSFIGRVKGYAKLTYYYKFCIHFPIKRAFYIDSRGGKDLAGNLFQIAQEACGRNIQVYLSVRHDSMDKVRGILKAGHFPGLKIVTRYSREYYKALGTSKYWLTDMCLDYSAVKRPEQIFINTWHGTPLKTLEFDWKDHRHEMGGGPRDHLRCDYMAVPNRFLFHVLLSSSHVEPLFTGKALYCGYPRNSIFFDVVQRQQVRQEKELEGKEVFAYLPTWRNPSPAEIYQEYSMTNILDFFEACLRENQILFVKLHNFSTEEIDYSKYQKVRPFPKDVDTYTMLNAVDCLITDYSSVFFDYANTKKKVILFTYDHKEYPMDRSLYFTLDEMPFPKVYTFKELAEELNINKNYDDREFLQRFCAYDCPNAAQKLLEVVVDGKNTCETEDVCHNGKRNVLIYDATLTARILDERPIRQFLESLDPDKANYFYCYRQDVLKKTPAYLQDLPRGIRIAALTCDITYTLGEKLAIKFFGHTWRKGVAHRELQRQFGGKVFDKIQILGENEYDPFCNILKQIAKN